MECSTTKALAQDRCLEFLLKKGILVDAFFSYLSRRGNNKSSTFIVHETGKVGGRNGFFLLIKHIYQAKRAIPNFHQRKVPQLQQKWGTRSPSHFKVPNIKIRYITKKNVCTP